MAPCYKATDRPNPQVRAGRTRNPPGQILAHSEQYVDKQSAKEAIDSIKKEAASATTQDES